MPNSLAQAHSTVSGLPARGPRRGVALGSGLVSLDVIFGQSNSAPISMAVGGTCANVLLALRYLGWDTAPISRLSNDASASLILKEMHAWGVNTQYVAQEPGGGTPVIVQRIRQTKSGAPRHSFSWNCPACGNRFPPFRPVLASIVEELADKFPVPKLFFFDRVSRGILRLAQKSAELGAVVVFEPISVGVPKLFSEAWAVSHIVKYSAEKIRSLPALASTQDQPLLHIKTMGADGLMYRHRLHSNSFGKWHSLQAHKVPFVADTAGAGDWCTAGMLDALCTGGLDALKAIHSADLLSALSFAQGLAAWSCMFAGARGGMLLQTREQCLRQVKKIIAGELQKASATTTAQSHETPVAALCPVCDELYSTVHS